MMYNTHRLFSMYFGSAPLKFTEQLVKDVSLLAGCAVHLQTHTDKGAVLQVEACAFSATQLTAFLNAAYFDCGVTFQTMRLLNPAPSQDVVVGGDFYNDIDD